MSKKISYAEFKRRMFNKTLIECFNGIHTIINNESDDGSMNYSPNEKNFISETFFRDMLSLDTNQISQTKNALGYETGCNAFIHDCIEISEAIAENKTEELANASVPATDDNEMTEFSDEDNSLLKKLFDTKMPVAEINAVRDAASDALLQEKKRAEELKDVVDMSKMMPAGTDNEQKKIEEAVNKLTKNVPQSLFHAIITRVSSDGVTAQSNSIEGMNESVSSFLKNKSEDIIKHSLNVFTLYEMAHCFGIHEYSESEVKKISNDIFFGN